MLGEVNLYSRIYLAYGYTDLRFGDYLLPTPIQRATKPPIIFQFAWAVKVKMTVYKADHGKRDFSVIRREHRLFYFFCGTDVEKLHVLLPCTRHYFKKYDS